MPLALGDPRLITTWTALRRGGVSPDRIRAQLAGGRWRRCGYAIALHNGPLTREQQWFVARAHGGPQALTNPGPAFAVSLHAAAEAPEIP